MIKRRVALRCFLAILLFPWGSESIADTFVDKPLTYHVKNSDGHIVTVNVPYIVTENKAIADRINVFLHMDLLKTLAPLASNKLSTTRIINYDFPLSSMNPGELSVTNGGRVVSVEVESEGCGAYCSTNDSTYNFDSQTGHFINGDELLTPEGKLALAKLAIKKHSASLREAIENVKKGAKDNKDMLGDEDRATKLDIYQDCLSSRFTEGGSDYASYLLDPGYVEIGDGALIFSHDSCSAHATQALDDLSSLSMVLKATEIRDYLTDYGKYLMLGEGKPPTMPINPYGQVFKGVINNHIGVTLYIELLKRDAVTPGSRYFYNRFGDPVELTMSKKGDLVELTETDSKEDPKPVLSFRVKDNKLVGEWRGAGKVFTFEATP